MVGLGRALAVLLSAMAVVACASPAVAKVRVLFVGGDWKSQLPNYDPGKQAPPIALRGYFVRDALEKAAPGRFDLTLWTSYEFLQYGDRESLRQFDVIVAGDVMGQSVMPRLVKGLTDFVAGGGGFWYCDNHKAFMFYTPQRSFDDVLPVEMVPFRAYGPEPLRNPLCQEPALLVKPAVPDHPVMKGLDFSNAPALKDAHYGPVKKGATVLATSPAGKPIWVAWEGVPKAGGRTLTRRARSSACRPHGLIARRGREPVYGLASATILDDPAPLQQCSERGQPLVAGHGHPFCQKDGRNASGVTSDLGK